MTGMHTPEEIKARIEEAGETLRRLHVSGCWPHGHRTSWPEYVTEGWWGDTAMDVETGRAADTVVKPSPPSAKRITELEEFERWVEMVGDDYEMVRLIEVFGFSENLAVITAFARRSILWARAYGLSYRKIARKMGRSHEWVRANFEEAVERIASRKNGRIPDTTAT